VASAVPGDPNAAGSLALGYPHPEKASPAGQWAEPLCDMRWVRHSGRVCRYDGLAASGGVGAAHALMRAVYDHAFAYVLVRKFTSLRGASRTCAARSRRPIISGFAS
jgi:hypothetical protein